MSLTELVRRGDRTMIQFAVELEVSQFLGREYYRNDPQSRRRRVSSKRPAKRSNR